jgi:hypothetical protein
VAAGALTQAIIPQDAEVAYIGIGAETARQMISAEGTRNMAGAQTADVTNAGPNPGMSGIEAADAGAAANKAWTMAAAKTRHMAAAKTRHMPATETDAANSAETAAMAKCKSRTHRRARQHRCGRDCDRYFPRHFSLLFSPPRESSPSQQVCIRSKSCNAD